MQFKKHTYNIILVAALAALTGLTMFGQDVRRNRSLKKASVAQFTPDSIRPARRDLATGEGFLAARGRLNRPQKRFPKGG